MASLDPSAPVTWAQARPALMPKVREHAFFWEALEAELSVSFPGDLGQDLRAVLVIDSADSCAYLSQKQLQEWGVSIEQATDAARYNLWGCSNQEMCLISPGLYASPWQDSYDASRLVLPRLFRPLPVRGAPVVAVPHRDLVLLTGSEDPQGQAALFQRLLKESERPYAWVAVEQLMPS